MTLFKDVFSLPHIPNLRPSPFDLALCKIVDEIEATGGTSWRKPVIRETDTLLITCSELGTAPDSISCAKPERFFILQRLAASIASVVEYEKYDGISSAGLEQLIRKYEFRHAERGFD